ncbi:MAG: mRNA surveillance protein pelota [Candidatus Woesearchaeota archaeon]|jgi:protein pelota|nr:mRNA surveillance protein pelota [Candidatus Woesearchaeota archaeon]MDP7180895.1 mRNA surveillance protein pelota [Candidatus Woesearchaeota archaeon]MDP7199167.1 mRNA surveillance protein pelota [Candidatus Woesearchaeota archaeon]MDP7467570.1 mRNA surveillance protein pelota [Candidatus Woesearchaeota archaeon]MDP7647052.1 mRNA surveillance protein pelota [Candidatus Woesearchaeota archaeon]
MKVLHKHKEEVRLLIETVEDLWYLHSILEEGDIVEGKTIRKVKKDEQEGKRKPMFLSIKVERQEFMPTQLRVLGTIVDGPEDVPRGEHHSFMVEEGSKIKIIKEWSTYHWARIKEATEKKPVHILMVVFDRESCLFANVEQNGFDILSKLQGNIQKKQFDQQVRGNFFKDIAQQIDEYEKRKPYDHIVVGSPSFWKTELMQQLTYPWKDKVVAASASTVDEAGLREAFKSEDTEKALHLASTSKEVRLVEELLSRIATSEKVAYGIEDVKKSAPAVEKLLVTNHFVAKMREQKQMKELEALLNAVEEVKGKIFFISDGHEGGKKLDGLGGIAAFLRYIVTG